MGRARRFNSYDDAVSNSRKQAESAGISRQIYSGIGGGSFRSPPKVPPIPQIATAASTSSAGSTGDHISASLSADQTTNLSANDHIEFDTKDRDGGVVLQTGAGQADGIFQLTGNKTYKLSGQLRPEFSGATGELVVAWYDITNSAELGKRGIYQAQTNTGNNANQPLPEIIVQPGSNVTVELRIISVTALTAIANEYSIATIFEISNTDDTPGGTLDFFVGNLTTSPTQSSTGVMPFPDNTVGSSGSSITPDSVNDKVTLEGGKSYKLEAYYPLANTGGHQISFIWRTVTGSTTVSNVGVTRSSTIDPIEGFPPASAIVSPTSDTEYEIYASGITGTPQISGSEVLVTIVEMTKGSGSGDLSFPIRPTITTSSSPSSTHDLDLNTTNGHIFKITADKDFTLTFSNPPASGIQQTFEIELTNDSTSVERTVTLPSSVRQLSSITMPATTPVSRGVYTLRVNDGGSNYDIIEIVDGTTGSAAAQTPWTSDIDGDDNSLLNLDQLRFNAGTGPLSTAFGLGVNAGGTALGLNVPTASEFRILVNGIDEWTFSNSTMTGESVILSSTLTINDSLTDPSTNGTFQRNGNDVKVFTGGVLKNLSDIGTTASAANQQLSNLSGTVRPNLDILADQTTGGNLGSTTSGDEFFNIFSRRLTFPIAATSIGASDYSFGRLTNVMTFNVPTSSFYSFEINGVREMSLTNTELILDSVNLDMENNTITDANALQLTGSTGDTNLGRLVGVADGLDIITDQSGDFISFWTNQGGGGLLKRFEIKDDQLITRHNHVIESTGSTILTFDTAGTGDRILMAFAGTSSIQFDNSEVDINEKTFRMSELTSAPTGSANNAKIYCEDNGAGKTRLMVKFGTGSAQQIAIEP